MMKANRRLKNIIISILLLLFIGCNYFSSTGRIEITINKNKKFISDLDTIEIWCPYNYYCIHWQIFVNNKNEITMGGKGYSFGDDFWGSFHLMNNHMSQTLLNVDSLNKALKATSVEKPHLIWYTIYKPNDSTYSKGFEFIMFTKNKDIYNSNKQLFDLVKTYTGIK